MRTTQDTSKAGLSALRRAHKQPAPDVKPSLGTHFLESITNLERSQASTGQGAA